MGWVKGGELLDSFRVPDELHQDEDWGRELLDSDSDEPDLTRG